MSQLDTHLTCHQLMIAIASNMIDSKSGDMKTAVADNLTSRCHMSSVEQDQVPGLQCPHHHVSLDHEDICELHWQDISQYHHPTGLLSDILSW